MDTLFDEIIETIFYFIDLKSIIKIVPLICKRWRNIAYNMLEYKNAKATLNTDGLNSPRQEIIDILNEFDNDFNGVSTDSDLNRILFREKYITHKKLIKHFNIIKKLFSDRFKHIKKIYFTNFLISDDMLQFNFKSLKLCTNVTKLELFSCPITDSTDLSPILYLKEIKKLKISECENITNLDVIKDLVSLEKLHIRQCDNICILPPLGKLKKLYKVDLVIMENLYDISGLANLNIKYFVAKYCHKLKSFDNIGIWEYLLEFKIETCDLIQDLYCLKYNYNLQELTIGNCINLKTFRFINDFKSLKELRLWKNDTIFTLLTLYDLPKLKWIEISEWKYLNELNFINVTNLCVLHIEYTKINKIRLINTPRFYSLKI